MQPRVRTRALARAAAFGLALAVPVAVLAYLVRAQVPAVVAFDERAVLAATDLTRAHPALLRAALAWQELFQARWVNLAGGLVCLWVWRRHGLASRALWAFVTILAGWGLQLAVKAAVQRARPVVDDALTDAPGSSFPSGHVTNFACTATTVTLLVWPLLGRRGRAVAATAAAALLVGTGLDRVGLGAHFPSDVTAGALLGTAIAGASYVGYAGWRPPDSEPPPRSP
jgi:undecaprenyl-diphosphatase